MDIKYKLLFIIVIIYIVILGLLLYIRELNKTELLIYPNILLQYDGKLWKRSEYTDAKKYKIFIDNHYLYDSEVIVNEDTVIINNEEVEDFIGLSNDKIKIIDFKTEEMTDEEIKKILEILKIPTTNEVSIKDKITIDIDNDKKMETLYFIANNYRFDESEKLFSSIYIEDDKEYIVRNQSFEAETRVKSCYLSNVIDKNNDNKYELIVKCPGFSLSKTEIKIYEIKNNRLVLTNEL